MGLAYGVAETFNALAVILAPLLAGALYTCDPELVYAVSLGLLGLSVLVTLAFTPRPRSEEPAAAHPSLEI
jgi:hypothetical protein